LKSGQESVWLSATSRRTDHLQQHFQGTAHAEQAELLAWYKSMQSPARIVLVHGDNPVNPAISDY
jgi:Cft2 family RNA processing exonuclease